LYRNSNKVAELNSALAFANAELEEKVGVRTQALLQYSEELQRSNRELEEFAFVASHDLQEPLRKIRAFGDRLQQKFSAELGETGSDYVLRMQSASERMSALIDDLLSFSRVTTKQRPFVRVDLNEVMHRVMDDLDYSIEETNAQLHIDPLPIIDADASQIAQVFMNLIANSLKFHSLDARPIIAVTSEINVASPVVDDIRSWCCLRFSDQGIGFEAQYAERVFSLFQRLHGRNEYSGTGIGLALCRKIIERHGGTITAQSEPREGAIFTIYLPMTQTLIEPLADLLSGAP
jgi:light-regulated signal transduction histidine kinase (bacteriophytochrome)